VTPFVEPWGTWRSLWIVAGAVAAFVGLEIALPGRDLPWYGWPAPVVVLGIVAIGCLSARRAWSVRVDCLGPDAALPVGRERDPAPLYEALVVRLTASAAGTPGEGSGSQGTLAS
jgi:hypothetical protein